MLILAGLITWIATSGRRRKAAAAGWRSRLIDAYAKGSALHDAMSVAEVQGDLGGGDARARCDPFTHRMMAVAAKTAKNTSASAMMVVQKTPQ